MSDIFTNKTETSKEPQLEVAIKQKLGSTIVFTGGRDYDSIRTRAVQSTYYNAEDGELALHINQGKNGGITISLETLESIIKWAKEMT